MNKKHILMIFCIVSLTTSILAFDKPTQVAKRILGFVSQEQESKRKENSSITKTVNDSYQERVTKDKMPAYVVYDMLFNMVKMLDHEAAKLESEGKSGKIWSDYFKHENRLSDEQMAVLRKVSDEFAAEIEPNRTQAMRIISEIRAAYPKGQIHKGVEPPEPPKELIALQQERQEIALRHRDRLRSLFGDEAFKQLNQSLSQSFVKDMRPVGGIPPSILEKAKRLAEEADKTSTTQQGGEER